MLLASRLPRDRFDVRVAVLQKAGPWADQLRRAGVRVDVLGWQRLIDPTPFIGLRRCLADFQPDILHVWRLSGLRWAVIVGGWARCRVIVSMPFAAVDGGFNLGWLDRALLVRADRVVAWGPYEADRFRRMGVPERKVAVIPPGMDIPGEPAAAPELRASVGLTEAARLVVGVGPLEPQKGFRDAIWALELVHHLCGDLHLVLVGTGPDRRRLERFTRLIQATARIHFAGPEPDLPGVLAEAEVVSGARPGRRQRQHGPGGDGSGPAGCRQSAAVAGGGCCRGRDRLPGAARRQGGPGPADPPASGRSGPARSAWGRRAGCGLRSCMERQTWCGASRSCMRNLEQGLSRERCTDPDSGRRQGNAPGTADPRPRQARRAVRGPVSHHRFHAVQLHQQRSAPDSRPDAVQGPQPRPPHRRRLELPAAASSTNTSRSCRRSSASTRTGTRAPPTPSTRTSTPSRRPIRNTS